MAHFPGVGQTTGPVYNGPHDWVHFIPQECIARGAKYQDITSKASWTLSSCKNDIAGQFGLPQMMSENMNEYWRSDGPAPHSVTIEFQKKTDVCFLFIYLDHSQDESYTPQKARLCYGSSMMQLDGEIQILFENPVGWMRIDLLRLGSRPLRTFVLYLVIEENHQFGKDCHVRRMRVVGPVDPTFPNLVEPDPCTTMMLESMPTLPGKRSDWMNPPPLR